MARRGARLKTRAKIWSFVAALVFLIAPARAQTAPAPITQIALQRTWCYGACPIDEVTLESSGEARYNGVRNAPRLGAFRGSLAPAKFADLARGLEEQNFFELRSEIGSQAVDLPVFLVRATRGGREYSVVFHSRGNEALEKRLRDAFEEATSAIEWQRDEAVSNSGVNGVVRRPLTSREARILKDRQPPVTEFVFPFALVSLSSRDGKRVLWTRADQEGRFHFFAALGNYNLQARDENGAQPYVPGAPLYLSKSVSIVVEAAKFAPATLRLQAYGGAH